MRRTFLGPLLGLALALVLAPLSTARADEIGSTGFAVPTEPPPQPVTAPPPPFVELQSRQLAAGVGFSWGSGTLSFEGRNHAFDVKSVSLGDVGVAKLVGEGEVRNLERLDQFAGTYLAAEAGAAAGKGVSHRVLRNEHGVVIRLRSDVTGLAFSLGAEGVRIALR